MGSTFGISEHSDLAGTLAEIRDRIARACHSVNRDESEVTLIAVTKTLPSESVRKAYAAGIRNFGENRVQEIIDKFADGSLIADCPDIDLHLIGHLQSNKVRKAVQYCRAVDSVDDFDLAEAINSDAAELGKKIRVLVEVNTSNEPQKFGIPPQRAVEIVEGILPLPHLELVGLMTVGPLTSNPLYIRQSFVDLRKAFEDVRDKLNPPNWSVLSMGMSGDFEMAIEEGATEIRLGTALFGARRAY